MLGMRMAAQRHNMLVFINLCVIIYLYGSLTYLYDAYDLSEESSIVIQFIQHVHTLRPPGTLSKYFFQ